MKIPSLTLAALLFAVTLTACSGGSASASRGGADRGEASMQLDGETWEASSAKARLKNGKLSLSFSTSRSREGITERDQLSLSLLDYSGPGSYTMTMGSTFVKVSINTAAFTEPDADQEESARPSMASGVNAPTALSLTNAIVEITAETGAEIRGTFSRTPPKGGRADGGSITDGRFRALIR